MRVLVPIFCITGAFAAASELETWGDSGIWQILIDASVGNGCLAQRSFDDGTLVQIGAHPAQSGGFFAAYNFEWTDIQNGAVGIVSFNFGDERFAGDVVGKIRQGLPGGYAFFDNPNFITEFAKRQTVTVSGESGRLLEIDLTGSKTAIDSILACQKEQPEPASN